MLADASKGMCTYSSSHDMTPSPWTKKDSFSHDIDELKLLILKSGLITAHVRKSIYFDNQPTAQSIAVLIHSIPCSYSYLS